jgi:hypothetical protein
MRVLQSGAHSIDRVKLDSSSGSTNVQAARDGNKEHDLTLTGPRQGQRWKFVTIAQCAR